MSEIDIDIQQDTNPIEITTPTATEETEVQAEETQNNTSYSVGGDAYYTDLAKDWAIKMNSKVLGQDYSSKYYAYLAKTYKETAESAVDGIEQTVQTAIADIQTAKTVAIDDIDTAASYKITEINSLAADFETDLTALTTRAETAATNAEGAVSMASDYANASASSATEASYYKTQAQTAVSNAQSYSISASQSATQANTYKTQAETAQRNANSFANQAQDSASAASTSESRARQYATVASESAGRAEAAEQDVQQIKEEIESELDNYVPKTTEVNGKALNGNITLNASDVGALPDTTKYGKSIAYSLDSTTYVLTLTLKDQNNNALNSVNIDLPLESYILNVSYDNTTKELVISYQNGSTIRVPIGAIIGGLQSEITSTNMLDSDLVDDTNNTHKFATASQLAQIATNTTNIGTINTTLGGYGNIVNHNTSEFAIASQGAKADTAIQSISINGTILTPDINNKVAFTVPLDTGDLTNNAGYIKGITSADVIAALGYTPYNSSNPDSFITSAALSPYALISSLATVATSGSYNDLADKPYIPSGVVVDQTFDGTSTNAQSGVAIAGELNEYVKLNGGSTSQTISLISGTGTTPLTLKSKSSSSCYVSYNANGTWVGSLGVNSSKRPSFYNGTSYTLAYTSDIPTDNSQLTNGAGYTSNIGTVISVNGTQPDSNGNVSISIPSITDLANKDLSNLSSTGEAKFQAPIPDLSTIRAGASAGATALQSVSYNDVIDALSYVPANRTTIDGEWTKVASGSTKVIDNVSLDYGSNYSVSLTSILPSGSTDLYEILVTGNVTSGATAGNFARIYLDAGYGNEIMLCFCRTRSASSVEAAGTAIIPVYRSTALTMLRSSGTNLKGTANMWILAYRKVR